MDLESSQNTNLVTATKTKQIIKNSNTNEESSKLMAEFKQEIKKIKLEFEKRIDMISENSNTRTRRIN